MNVVRINVSGTRGVRALGNFVADIWYGDRLGDSAYGPSASEAVKSAHKLARKSRKSRSK